MRRRILCIILTTILLFTSCGTVGDTKEVTEDIGERAVTIGEIAINTTASTIETLENDDYIPLKNITTFTYDGDGNLYYVIGNTDIYCEDKNGNILFEYIVKSTSNTLSSDMVNDIVAENGFIYYSAVNHDFEAYHTITTFFMLDMETKTEKELFKTEYDGFPLVTSIKIVGNKLFTMAVDGNYSERAVLPYSVEDHFDYFGERIFAVDLTTFEVMDVGIDYPIAITNFSENELYINAYDEIKGRYFIKYNVTDNTFGERQYNNAIRLDSFEMCGFEDYIVYPATNELYIAKISNEESKINIAQNISAVGSRFIANGESVYYLEWMLDGTNTIKEVRYNLKNLLKKSVHLIGNINLPALGYTIKKTRLEVDELMLKLMANDTDWDIAYCSVNSDYLNIMNKQLFYPMNDIPAINEFYDKTLPFINDAFIMPDGKISALIYEIRMPKLAYFPEKLKALGVTINGDETLPELLLKLGKVSEKITPSQMLLSESTAMFTSLTKYTYNYKSINTDKFREFAKLIYDNYNISKLLTPEKDSYINLNAMYDNKYSEAYFWENWDDYVQNTKTEGPFNVMPIPNMLGDEYYALCRAVIINPYTKNIDYVSEYIAALANDMMTSDNAYFFKDTSVYDQNKKFYYDSFIQKADKIKVAYQLPHTLYWLDFMRYLNDELTLDEMVTRINDNLDMYYNE